MGSPTATAGIFFSRCLVLRRKTCVACYISPLDASPRRYRRRCDRLGFCGLARSFAHVLLRVTLAAAPRTWIDTLFSDSRWFGDTLLYGISRCVCGVFGLFRAINRCWYVAALFTERKKLLWFACLAPLFASNADALPSLYDSTPLTILSPSRCAVSWACKTNMAVCFPAFAYMFDAFPRLFRGIDAVLAVFRIHRLPLRHCGRITVAALLLSRLRCPRYWFAWMLSIGHVYARTMTHLPLPAHIVHVSLLTCTCSYLACQPSPRHCRRCACAGRLCPYGMRLAYATCRFIRNTVLRFAVAVGSVPPARSYSPHFCWFRARIVTASRFAC